MLLELNHTVSVCYCENHSVHFDWICNMYYNVQIMYLSTEKPLFEIIILPLSLATERANVIEKNYYHRILYEKIIQYEYCGGFPLDIIF